MRTFFKCKQQRHRSVSVWVTSAETPKIEALILYNVNPKMQNNMPRLQFECTWEIRADGPVHPSFIRFLVSRTGAGQDQTEESLSIEEEKQPVSFFLPSVCIYWSFGLKEALKIPFPSVPFSPVACRLAGFRTARMVQFCAVTVWVIIQTLVGGKDRNSFKKWNTRIAV